MSEQDALEDRLGYHFKSKALLRAALTHRSAVKGGLASGEEVIRAVRMAWLGDAVLTRGISEYLFRRFPLAKASDLDRWRQSITNNTTLGRIAKELDLEKAIIAGGIIKRLPSATDRHQMLATTLEAVIAAVFVDAGHSLPRKTLERLFGEEIERVAPSPRGHNVDRK